MTLSALICAKNEESFIGGCIERLVPFVDEVVFSVKNLYDTIIISLRLKMGTFSQAGVLFLGKCMGKGLQGFQKGHGRLRTGESYRKAGKKISISLTGKKLSESHLENISGENGSNWRGDNVGYNGVHKWIVKLKGKPKYCELCHTKDKKKWYEWANIDHKYKRNQEDYMRLCRSCHIKYDIEFNGRPVNQYKKA